jgi:FkbM family methyltransferase
MNLSKADKPKRFLFNAQFRWPYGPVDYSLAMALRFRGHDVMMVACGGVPEYCELETNTQKKPDCSICLATIKRDFDRFNLPFLTVRDFIKSEDIAFAEEISSSKTVDELLQYRFNDIPIGTLARLNLYQYYHGYPFQISGEKEGVFRRAVHSAILFTIAKKRIFEKFNPDFVVTVNGKFLQWAPLVYIAKQADKKYVTWEDLDTKPSGVGFAVNDIAHEQRIDCIWDEEKHKNITEEERKELYEHFKLWAAGEISIFKYYDENTVYDKNSIKAKLELDDRPIISLFSNVSWDSTSVGFESAFESMYDWIFSVIDYAQTNKDLNFIIRTHPAEIKVPDSFKNEIQTVDVIQAKYSKLPENVRIVEPDSVISSYALANLSAINMVYTSTFGIELAINGKKPWIAANAYYSGKGFSVDIKSKQHLYELLDKRNFDNYLSHEEHQLAEIFANIVRCRRIFSFPFVNANLNTFTPPNLDVFAPGGNDVIDNLCNYILTGEPFLDIGLKKGRKHETEMPYKLIVADNNLGNIKLQAQQNRFGTWQVEFHGLTIFCHDLAAFYIAAKDIFLHRIYDFNTTNPAPTIIDAGGHIGLFTLYIKKRYPQAKITVFEPDTESIELLTKNIDANNIHNVDLVKAGLYKDDGEIDFGSDHSDGSSIFAKDKSTKVTVVRLSQYITSEIDFLKLNIEGAELDVLTEIESKLPFVKEMVIEYHGFPHIGQNLHKILTILDGAGFRYMIHDFDAETNPATKPPFQLDKEKQFFLLIYAKKLFSPFTYQKQETAPLKEINRVEPISRLFGFDRGTPIDRYYIETFLKQSRSYIRGRVLEIGDNTYTKKYGEGVTQSEVLNAVSSPQATIVGDLATGKNIPETAFDCIILTQTLLCIYDIKSAVQHTIKALKPGGTVLITVPGISQISRYDMERWGDYWRFTDKSLKMLLKEAGPDCDIEIETFGNVAIAKAYLDGLALEEVPREALEYKDNDYQLILTARVTKSVQNSIPKKLKKAEISMQTPLILLYHRVADDPLDSQLLTVSPKNFEIHLKELSENYRVIPLYELIEELQKSILTPDTVALTFDDGYLDNLLNAVPLLEKYRLHATIFVTAGMVGSDQEFWWDALERIFLTGGVLPESLEVTCQNGAKAWDLRTAQGRLKAYDELCSILRSDSFEDIQQSVHDLYEWARLEPTGRHSHRVLNQAQLQSLAKSPFIEIGSHSVTHARLSVISAEKQRWEIQESKKQLEATVRKHVRLFSYPYGTRTDFTHETTRIVAGEDYVAGIANIQGNIEKPVDLYAIPRRLVRNWAGDIFTQWLHDKNKDRFEAETISVREKSLIDYQISATNRQDAHKDSKQKT